jgi:hypothetical protein
VPDARPADGRHRLQIVCNEAGSSLILWLMALIVPLFGVLIAWYAWYAGMPLRYDVNARDFNPLALFPIVLSVVGLMYLVKAIMVMRRIRAFGTSTLTLDDRPRLGGGVHGHVTSTVDVTAGQWRAVLRCYESVRGTGTSAPRASEILRWHGESTQPGAAYSTGTAVPIDLPIPLDALDKTPLSLKNVSLSRRTRRWVLSVEGKRDGLDYVATFDLPIG